MKYSFGAALINSPEGTWKAKDDQEISLSLNQCTLSERGHCKGESSEHSPMGHLGTTPDWPYLANLLDERFYTPTDGPECLPDSDSA